MTQLKYLPNEFPDFDVNTLPPIPADWRDTSWHNDVSPSFDAMGSDDPADQDRLHVWVDYANPQDREFPECARYGAYLRNAKDETIYSVEDNDWQVILAGVEMMRRAWPAVKATGSPEGY